MPLYLPQNLWRQILKNMSGRELAQVYGTNTTVRNLINSNNVLYKRWQAARNLHHKATPNVYANLPSLDALLAKSTIIERFCTLYKVSRSDECIDHCSSATHLFSGTPSSTEHEFLQC